MGLEETNYTPAGRYRLIISYDGSNYGGWQIQPNSVTVQGELQRVLTRLYGGAQLIHLIGCSRTDAGVHALGFVASFLIPERPEIEPEKLRSALNRLLPVDIRVVRIEPVPLTFHSRYDALGKAYTYVINRGDETPFANRYSWRTPFPLDPDRVREAAGRLEGTHDYSSFVVERSKLDEDPIRTIYRIDVQEFGDHLALTYIGNGFLYKMIRCLTGTLAFAGAGRLSADAVTEILQAKNRLAAPDTAPGRGLFLMKVFYEPEQPWEFHLDKLPFAP
ncbi:MAG: tRNA pseudouridine(38-40) synthase TruA [Victivallaceae bacterium]|nr:tRNA pseudouridine(38-40) synthase TruA [Victivallaceae bacterium]